MYWDKNAAGEFPMEFPPRTYENRVYEHSGIASDCVKTLQSSNEGKTKQFTVIVRPLR